MNTIVLLSLIVAISTASPFDDVRAYLRKNPDKSTGRAADTNWLENSNTIGLGYNPLYGNPVCYTGNCQYDGFRRSIFKLTFVEAAMGSCTSKLIPNNVELHCIPSSDIATTSEMIGTLKQLSESTSNGISFGADGKYQAFSAGYSFSKETRYMVDNIVKQERTSIFTAAKVTFGKLSMFEPLLELSAAFRYVIEHMPCCQYDDTLENYVKEFIIDRFGFTFINELMLGGIAQQTLFIANKDVKKMQQNGQDISNSATIGFFVNFNMKVTTSYDKKKQDEFSQSINTSRSTKLGGDPSIQNIDEWIKSVPSNPVIMRISVKGIVHLLSRNRFPDDPLIQNKSKLVDMVIKRYLDGIAPFCYNNCTSSNNGKCDLTGPIFLLGTCKCKQGWKGADCSERERHTYDITPEEGPWGSYRNWAYCPQDTWAIGFRQRVEAPCGKCDDTALNSLELICSNSDRNQLTRIQSYEGVWGSWGSDRYCNGKGNYLRGVQFLIEREQGKGDDTAANDSRFTCTNGDVIQGSNGGTWGNWRSEAQCPPSSAICGLQIKFESEQGKGDDTAMNGARFKCCSTF